MLYTVHPSRRDQDEEGAALGWAWRVCCQGSSKGEDRLTAGQLGKWMEVKDRAVAPQGWSMLHQARFLSGQLHITLSRPILPIHAIHCRLAMASLPEAIEKHMCTGALQSTCSRLVLLCHLQTRKSDFQPSIDRLGFNPQRHQEKTCPLPISLPSVRLGAGQLSYLVRV